MKKFIKENWFKFSLMILILIIILSYFLFIKPTQGKKEDLVNNIKCQQEGFQLSEKDKKDFFIEHEENKGYKDFGDIEYRFVKELNTCLYKYSTTTGGEYGYFNYKFIKDAYTNKLLVEYNNVTFPGKEPLYTNKEKYELMESKYFPK